MAVVARRISTRRNETFGIESVLFEVTTEIDQQELRRYENVRDRATRNDALGFLFGDLLAQIEEWILTNCQAKDHVQISLNSRDLTREIKTPISRAHEV